MLLALYSFTILLGAALLFLVQPMVAKMVLPRLGGSASVWVACMLFFQALLLAGYAYADALTRRLRPRVQLVVHVAVLALAALALPAHLPPGWEGPGTHPPALWLLALLARTIGFPFFVVATTGPLLQAWFARSGHRQATDPYFLYAASNLGSLAGLLAYPFLLEPLLPLARGGLRSQSGLWAAGYAIYGVGVLACGFLVRHAAGPSPVPVETGPPPTLRQRLQWMLLAFVPSSVLLGATQSMGSEVAPVPLLWVLPLTAYLLSFVLAFRPRRRVPEAFWRAALVVSAAVTVGFLWGEDQGFQWGESQPTLLSLVSMHLATVFTAGRVLHGRLAALRPRTAHLTTFYLWIALGGVLGGVMNALLAPRVFDSIVEYPLALALACLLAAGRPSADSRTARLLDLVLPVALAAAVAVVQAGWMELPWPELATFGGVVVALGLMGTRPRRVALALLLVTTLSQALLDRHLDVLFRERTFFGVYRVESVSGRHLQAVDLSGRPVQLEVPAVHVLLHGVTRHGSQAQGPRADMPTGYYHPSSPIARIFRVLEGQGAKDFGVVGLGTGTLALYASPRGRMIYYEIDPAVVAIARNPRLFTFLQHAAGPVDVRVADGRLGVAALPDRALDLLVLDAFSSDAIPVHLLTREAFALYEQKLRPGAVIAVHISNAYLDLAPVLAALAEEEGLHGMYCEDHVWDVQQKAEWKEPSTWIVLSRDPGKIQSIRGNLTWDDLALYRHDDPALRWTDDRSDLLRAIHRD
jgi:hypothetical protein